MRRVYRGLAAVFMIILCSGITGCAGAPVQTAPAESEPVKLMYAADLHLYAPELIGDFERFCRDLEYGDGKAAQYSFEIAQAMVDAVLREKPDAFLLGGDLSLNGEYESHLALAGLLKPLSDAGIPVLVTPGNHDINNLGAFSRADGDSCRSIDMKGFRSIYGALGMNGAISSDKDSLSYIYAINDGVYVLMLDTCEYDGIGRSTGSVSEKTMKWIKKQLESAQKTGKTVLSVSHHNLFQHSSLWAEPFVVSGSEPLAGLLAQYGVKLNLTGHMHIQHITQAAGGLPEAATGSLAVSPNYYGVIDIDTDKSIHYAAESLDVSDWASRAGSTDVNLLDFSKYSREFFEKSTRIKVTETLEQYRLSDDDRAQMTEFAVLMNQNYFGGTIASGNDDLIAHPGYALWLEKCPGEFFSAYIESIMSDKSTEHTYIEIP